MASVDGSGGAMSASDSTKPEVRKTVTVLFSDVADSTPLGEMLDPESTRALLSQFFEVVQDSSSGTVAPSRNSSATQ